MSEPSDRDVAKRGAEILGLGVGVRSVLYRVGDEPLCDPVRVTGTANDEIERLRKEAKYIPKSVAGLNSFVAACLESLGVDLAPGTIQASLRLLNWKLEEQNAENRRLQRIEAAARALVEKWQDAARAKAITDLTPGLCDLSDALDGEGGER
jgi:hypothetical protein